MERQGACGSDSPHIWSISDGRAGNARQADALACALGGAPRRIQLQPRAPWRWLAPRMFPLAEAGYGRAFRAALATPPAIAVGCGRQAALATRLLRARGAAAVQILDPRLDPGHWDLVVAPEHDRLEGRNVIALLGSLHPVDDDWLAAARRASPVIGTLPGPRRLLLLGGPTRHAPFDAARLDAWLADLLAVQARDGGSLLASVSRRTPAAMAARLRERLAGVPGLHWTGEGDGPNPYPGLLAWADQIVCSPDSVNMVSEACATRVPVHVLDQAATGERPRRFLDALAARGRLSPLDAAPAPQPPLRELPRVATEILARLAGRAG